MGRFYKTASAKPEDYMYKLNTPLLQAATLQNDKYIDQQQAVNDGIEALSKYNHLEGDNQDAQNTANYYTQQTHAISDVINKDPANWRKQQDNIRGLKQQITQDYTSGAIAAQMSNFNARKQAHDAVDTGMKLYETSGGKKGISPERGTFYKGIWDSKFKKTDYTGPNSYNKYQGGTVLDDLDVAGELGKGLDKIKASGQIIESPTQKGMYLINTKDGYKGVTPETIMEAIGGNISPHVVEYLKREQESGLIPDAKAYLTDITKSLIAKNSWSQTDHSQTIKGDPVKLDMYNQNQATGRTQMGINAANQRFNVGQANIDRRLNVAEQNKFKLAEIKTHTSEIESIKKRINKGGEDGKKAKDELAAYNMLETIGDAPRLSHSYQGDLDAGDTESVNAVTKKALDQVIGDKPDLKVKNYLMHLNGQKSTEATLKQYISDHKLSYPENKNKNDVSSLVGASKEFNSGTGNTKYSSSTNTEITDMTRAGERYNKTIDNLYTEKNLEKIQKKLSPISYESQGELANMVNSGSTYFNIIDDNGKAVQVKNAEGKMVNPTIDKVFTASGASENGRLMYQALTKDDKGNTQKVWILPNGNDYEMSQALLHNTFSALKDKNSALGVELSTNMLSDIMSTLKAGAGEYKPIQLGKTQYRGKLQPNGKIWLTDEDGNRGVEVSSPAKMLELVKRLE